MAYRLRYYVDIDWVGEGTGVAGVGMAAANNPVVGAVGVAQTQRLQGEQWVVGGGYGTAPTTGNFLTACTGMATDISNQLNANSLAIYNVIKNWETGLP